VGVFVFLAGFAIGVLATILIGVAIDRIPGDSAPKQSGH
jgi:hypothetical protein